MFRDDHVGFMDTVVGWLRGVDAGAAVGTRGRLTSRDPTGG